MGKTPEILEADSQTIQKMLAASMHLGSKNLNFTMQPYIYGRRPDGVHVLNIKKTWEKLVLAARVLATVENPEDICVISGKNFGHRAVHKFAKYTGAQSVAGRFTPGTFTNYITRTFREPQLLIVADPLVDSQAIKEASYVNIPVIAFCDTDVPLKYVDIAIPTNTKSKNSIGLGFWLLARELLRLRGSLPRDQEWEVMVDMFIYRDPDQEVVEETKEEAKGDDWQNEGQGQWSAEQPQDWAAEQPQDWANEQPQDWADPNAAPAW
eukprot:NODE_1128_length_2079_cov_0.366667.p1 type:complete len:266 gc:universal NODE_1128_length_2079_cov_0.366667:1048-251(-)